MVKAHTALPFRKCLGIGAVEIRGESSDDVPNPRICRVMNKDPNSDANVELILTACNTHEKLIDALIRALPFLEDAKGSDTYKPGYVDGVIAKVRAVLDEAGAL